LEVAGLARITGTGGFSIGEDAAQNRIRTISGSRFAFYNSSDVLTGLAIRSIGVGATFGTIATPTNGAIIEGNVGIGTSSPALALDVIGTTSGSLRLSADSADAANKLGRIVGRPYTNANANFMAFDIRGLATTNEINYGGGSGVLNAATTHRFFTAANNNTLSGTERMVLDSSGNLGVGTTSPTNYGAGYQTISANGTSSGVFEIRANNTVRGLIVGDATDLQIQASGATPMRFFTNGNERMRIASDGVVSIGGNTVLHAGNYGSYALPLSGGTMSGIINGRQPTISTAITSVTAAQASFRSGSGDSNVGSSAGFIPALGQTSVYTSGYRSHMVVGSYRTASGWGGGPFVAWGGSDSNATEYWLFNSGGSITYSGGRTFLDSSNYTSYPIMHYPGGAFTGNFQDLTNTPGELRIDQVNNINGGSYSNQPPNVYTYGGVLSWRLVNHSFQLYASHTGDLTFKTQWDNDNYSGWRRILHEANYTSFAPSLTGGGASGNWGINVTGTAGSISGYNNPTTAATANTIVYRDSGGDITGRYFFGVHFNQSSSNSENPTIAAFWTNSGADNYNRKSTPAHVISQLGLLTTSNYSSYALPLSGGTLSGTVYSVAFQPSAANGNSGVSGDYYKWGYQESGSWTYPYPDLILGYHTGMKFGAYYGYGGMRFYADHPFLSPAELFSIGNNDLHVRVANNLYVGGNLALHAGNYTSYALPLSGGTLSGNLKIQPVGEAWGEGLSFMMPTTGVWGGLRWQRQRSGYDGNWGVGYTALDSTDDLVFVANNGGSQINNILRLQKNGVVRMEAGNVNVTNSVFAAAFGLNGGFTISDPGSGYGQFNNWVLLPNTHGFYSGVNGAHFYPNSGAYGSWRIDGSRGGWRGIEFGSGSAGNVCLMFAANSNTTGFYNVSYGWQFYWEAGTAYVFKNAYGGGTGAVVLDSSNFASYALPVSGGTVTGVTYFLGNMGSGVYCGSSSNARLQAFSNDSGTAMMSFHRGGYYAVNMGLDPDNVLRIGGWSASANRFQMDMSGNLTMAGNVTAFSDIRLKANIRKISGALSKVRRLRGVTFTRIDQEDKERRHAGVIAQEMEQEHPEVVYEDAAGMKNVAYGNSIGLLIEAIKELADMVEELR